MIALCAVLVQKLAPLKQLQRATVSTLSMQISASTAVHAQKLALLKLPRLSN